MLVQPFHDSAAEDVPAATAVPISSSAQIRVNAHYHWFPLYSYHSYAE